MNQFANLSAENPMHALAKVASHEVLGVLVPSFCRIQSEDIGDNDRRDIVFDVFSMDNRHLAGFFNTYAAACAWATAHGFLVT